ncbi:MAG: translational GTPase TypA [Patescibacteria group bacterium]
MDQAKIRNIAIIAHVDHGKTTLVDHLLKQSHSFATHEAEMTQDTILDSNDLERERAITILAKNIAINWNGYKINIIDTPGHADFSGEVERVLSMADGCILLVDAAEGVLSQTRYVLALALKLKLIPIVIINKVDRKDQRADEVLNEINDLFLDLAVEPEQLEFPVLYAIGRQGKVGADMALKDVTDLSLLFQTIIDTIPAPVGDINGPAQIQISNLDYDNHKGRLAIGKITRGTLTVGQSLTVVRHDKAAGQGRITYIFTFKGLNKTETQSAQAGDIVALAGFDSVQISDTLCSPEKIEALPQLNIAPPILKVELSVSTSPLVGKDGDLTTARQLAARLNKEVETNVSLQVTVGPSGNSFIVAGRGELHISILVETMRREGYEFSVARPQVILKQVDGKTHEPFESVFIEVPEQFSGSVINAMGKRKAAMLNMVNMPSGVRFEYKIATSNLIGFRSELLSMTSGMSVVNSVFLDYEPQVDLIPYQRNGAIVSGESGQALGYSIARMQDRATTFVNPGEEVYRGMIIGLNSRLEDMEFNICRGKKLTNMRASTSDATIKISPALKMSLEQCLTFIGPDELLEVTPKHLRLRKKNLNYKR